MKRITLGLWLLIGLVLLGTQIGLGWLAAQRRADPAGAIMLSTLLTEHPYVLSEAQREEYDETLRVVREMADRRGDMAGMNPKLQAAVTPLTGTLLHELQGPWIIEISPEDGELLTLPRGRKSLVFDNLGPISLPGDIGVLLFHVDLGGDSTSYSTVEYDLSRQSRVNQAIQPGAENWVLVNLKNVPVDPTSVRLQLRPEGDTPLDLQVWVESPPPGRLKVRILSDDDGEPTPAMVNLIWKKNLRPRAPGNVVDMSAQFDRMGNSTPRRHAALKGKLAGQMWWCVAGPFDIQLPPGDWEMNVRRGLEHVPETITFAVESGKTIDQTVRPRRWVDMREEGWYSGDDHVHTRIMSDRDAENIMNWARAEDLHLSNIVKMGDLHRTFFPQRGFGSDFRTIHEDYILSPGQECPRTGELGHTISMNLTSMVRNTDNYFLYDWLFDNVHAQGGLAGYCHVSSKGFHVYRDMSMNVLKGKVDFVEVLQFGRLGTDLYYDFLNTGFKLTASAGSDVPWGGTIGEVRVYAYVGQNAFSADAWFEAVRRGRTFVTNGPMIEFSVEDALPGDEVKLPWHDRGRQLRVKARAWGNAGRMLPTELEIIRHGEVIRKATPDSDSQSELALDFEVDAEFGFWIAARATGSDGSQAHTTPVYVVQEPLRFWKHEAAQELISSRLESLAEIEKLVTDARQREKEGKAGYNQKELIKQGEPLLQRVEEARQLYRELEEEAVKERELRQ